MENRESIILLGLVLSAGFIGGYFIGNTPKTLTMTGACIPGPSFAKNFSFVCTFVPDSPNGTQGSKCSPIFTWQGHLIEMC